MRQECIVCEEIEDTTEMHTDGAEWYCQYCWEEYREQMIEGENCLYATLPIVGC